MRSAIPSITLRVNVTGEKADCTTCEEVFAWENPGVGLAEAIAAAERQIPLQLQTAPLLVRSVIVEYAFEDSLPRGTVALMFLNAYAMLANVVSIPGGPPFNVKPGKER